MATLASPSRVTPLARLWQRELDEYPTGGRRYGYLALVVLATIVLYYQNYVAGAVATQLLGSFHVSFLTFALIIAGSNAVGALASLASGIADRIGRANLAVYGLILCSLITLVWIPNTTTATQWGIATAAAGLVEGVILVATPALVRDFSPQVGRAQAMAFWTMGPVLGSLIVTEVTSHTLDTHPRWQDQFSFAGWAGLGVALLALVAMRELNATHRDRIVGALEAETEAALAARGLSHAEATRAPYRQMLKPDILLSSLAISIFLLFYYTAVGFLPVYFQTTLNFSASQANNLLNYLWGATAVSMLFFGIASDRLRVRKPFMLAGGLLTVLVDIAFLLKADDGAPSFRSVAILLVASGVWSGAAYVPWMASFTETVERRNPALSATGLAIWGWILRVVVAAAFVLIPNIVSSATPLVNDGPGVQAALARLETDYPALATEAQLHPDVFQNLAAAKTPAQLSAAADKAILVVGAEALTQLQEPKAQAELKALSTPTATKVQQAQKDAPGQWQTWFWICTFGALAFLPLTFLMAGSWRPRPQQDHHAIDHALANANRADHPLPAAAPSVSASPIAPRALQLDSVVDHARTEGSWQ
jgi:MFS family permease